MASNLSSKLTAFLRWWGNELGALLPRGPSAGRSRAARRLVVSVEAAQNRLILERSGRSETLAESDEPGAAGLAEIARAARERPNLPIGIRLGEENCFARTMELPAQAEAEFGRILDLDMERTTPFRSVDVLTAHYAPPGVSAPRGKRAILHLIVKRRTIEPILNEMRSLGIEASFADCWDEDRNGGVPVNFLASGREASRRRGSLAPILAGLVLALAISAVAIAVLRHQGALDALLARTEAARSEAASVRQAVEASQSVSAQISAMEALLKARLPIAHILEELTVIMPDSAWVSDLRIDGDLVEFTGFANSAASLVPLLEKSPLFSEASLTSPVIFDNQENKERFSVRLRLGDGGGVLDAGANRTVNGGAKL